MVVVEGLLVKVGLTLKLVLADGIKGVRNQHAKLDVGVHESELVFLELLNVLEALDCEGVLLV